MPDRTRTRDLPVRPDLDQLKRQAKELLRDRRAGDAVALEDFAAFHPKRIAAADAKLADAQLVLARSYGAASWPRLVRCWQIVDAIWRDDVEAVRALVTSHPEMIQEDALVRPDGRPSNWGPPMSYAANLGRDAIIRMLHGLGAKDHAHALDRAILQGKVATAHLLHDLAGNPEPAEDLLGGPAYTLSNIGTRFALDIGAKVVGPSGECLAPVHVVLETDSRNPGAKHRILELYEQHGLNYSDTPIMALHRGRIDLLERHLAREPGLLSRRFAHEEIYPPELGCHDGVLATHGTSLNGVTLLHMCMDYGEQEIAEWLIARGADVNARADVDADRFGGHTPLFNAVVSQVNFWPNHNRTPDDASLTRLLLDRGAEPNARASLRKQMHPGYGEHPLIVCRDVTPLGWGRRFTFRKLVSETAMRMIAEAGGA